MIICLVDAVLVPQWLIWSVIIQDDLCMLYAITLCTQLNIIFHLFDCIHCGGTF